MADCGRLSMAGDDECVVIKCQKLLLNGSDNFRIRSTPQVGAPDALRKKCVSRKQNVSVSSKMECAAARSVPRCMDDTDLESLACYSVAVLHEMIDRATPGHWHTNPLCLDVELFKQKEIGFMNGSGRLRLFLQFTNCSDVVDVCVRTYDLLCDQIVFRKPDKNLLK